MIAKEISPAAFAVLDAFRANWQDEPVAQDRECLASALRAVAEQLSYKLIVQTDNGDSHDTVVYVSDLLIIADELRCMGG